MSFRLLKHIVASFLLMTSIFSQLSVHLAHAEGKDQSIRERFLETYPNSEDELARAETFRKDFETAAKNKTNPDFSKLYSEYFAVEKSRIANLGLWDEFETEFAFLHPDGLVNKLKPAQQKLFIEGYYRYLQENNIVLQDSPFFHSMKMKPTSVVLDLDLPLDAKLAIAEQLKGLKGSGVYRRNDIRALLLEDAFKTVKTNPGKYPEAARYFSRTSTVLEMYYQKPAFEVAHWQMENIFHISDMAQAVKEGKVPANTYRRGIDAIAAMIDDQFGESYTPADHTKPPVAGAKDLFIDELEESMQSTPAESLIKFTTRRSFQGGRDAEKAAEVGVYAKNHETLFPHSYSRTGYLRIQDNHFFRLSLDEKSQLKNEFNQKELFEYLVGAKEERPKVSFKRMKAVFRDPESTREYYEKIYNTLDVWKRELSEGSKQAKISAYTEILDHIGLTQDDFREIFLREKADDPVYRAFFDAYYTNLSGKTRDFELAKNLSSFKLGGKGGVSIKDALEAGGPGRKKIGQNLYATKLAPASELPSLRLLLNEADPPSRIEFLSKIADALDLDNTFSRLHSVGNRVGSGSVNYGVKVKLYDLKSTPSSKDRKTVDAIIRIQRNGVGKEIQEEAELIERILKDLRQNPNPDVRKAAAKAGEAWEGASKSLLKTGQELDLSLERDLYPKVNGVYSRSNIHTKSGFKMEAVRPLTEYQDLVKDQYKTAVSIYEYVPNVDLEKVADKSLQKAMAEDVVSNELDAIFNGTFDKDGHEKNWLFDVEHKRIVRIDYAQYQVIPKDEIERFKQALKPFTRPYEAAKDPEKMAKGLSSLFEVGDHLDESLQKITPAHLKDWMHAKEFVDGTPSDRIFFIRDEIEKLLHQTVKLKSTANDALVALSKIQGMEAYIGKDRFRTLLGQKIFSFPEKVSIVLREKVSACSLKSLLERVIK